MDLRKYNVIVLPNTWSSGALAAIFNKSATSRLKSWIEAAKKRLHHNVLAIALANKLARIAWGVLSGQRNFEASVEPHAA